MSPQPIRVGGQDVDLSPRLFRSGTVAGSPGAAAETTVCSVTVSGDLSSALGVILVGYMTFTVGTSGTATTVKIRQTDTSGTVVKTSGATTAAAGNLVDRLIVGTDVGQVAARQVYVLTLTVTAGAAASTVSAAELVAIVV